MRLVIGAAVLLLAVAGMASAQDFKVGEIAIDHPWARPAAPPAPGGGYMVLSNSGAVADRLVEGSSPVVERVEFHRSEVTDGIARMVPQPDGIAIPAGGRVAFEPGGLHVMLVGLTQPLAVGQTIPLTLRFERAGAVTVEIKVQRRASSSSAKSIDHGSH